ncbi:hypothetical protein HZA45_00610 [Candidatus Peregrinibacteria bacterium]|nr:hypothetical protein [Candidatus Peregrinibacteria bacterium]
MTKYQRIAIVFLILLWSAAALALLFHNPAANPQNDTQMIPYALQFLRSLSTGDIGGAFFAMRKYPLLPVMVLAAFDTVTIGILFVTGQVSSIAQLTSVAVLQPTPFVLTARLFVLLSAIVSIVLAMKTVKRLWPAVPSVSVVPLLLSSALFFVFATSVRPHIPSIAMTLLTLIASIQLAKRKGWRREFLAFGAASLAFATLQNGVFAFIFPVVAWLSEDNRFQWKQLIRPRLPFLLVLGFLAASLAGYVYLWGALFGYGGQFGMGLGSTDLDYHPWQGHGFRSLGVLLLGSEPLLLIAAIFGVIHIFYQRKNSHPMVWSMLAYVGAYVLFFGLNDVSPQRYFLAILPLLAILGAPALFRYRSLFWAAILLGCFVSGRFLSLGLIPDTYQQAEAFLKKQTTGVIASQIPPYFLGIAPTRAGIVTPRTEKERFLLSLPDDIPDARPLLPMDEWQKASVVVVYPWNVPQELLQWSLCQSIVSVPVTDSVLLWGETDWALWVLLRAKALGPSIDVYCKEPSMEKPETGNQKPGRT